MAAKKKRKEAFHDERMSFHSRSKCEIWVDYQVACATLQEAEELCSSNWKKISYLLDRK
ncbi:MAG: mobility-associated LCxxNW protein [Anaerobutyricum soehngenii]